MKTATLSFASTGDIGDVIASLPTVRALGGGRYIVFERPEGAREGFGRETMRGGRYNAIRPLLEAQPYIESVEWQEGIPKAKDFSTFRRNPRTDESLVHWQARHFGIEIDTAPWLTVPRDERFRGRVVFARSLRYHNGFFPWFALLKKYPDAIFVGLPEEHSAFQKTFRCQIRFVPTSNLLELAQIIAVSRLFCGNQSCPWWIACGLGVTTFQETWLTDRNSMIERTNAFYMLAPTFNLDKLPA